MSKENIKILSLRAAQLIKVKKIMGKTELILPAWTFWRPRYLNLNCAYNLIKISLTITMEYSVYFNSLIVKLCKILTRIILFRLSLSH